MELSRMMRAGLAYMEQGWPVFVLGAGKVPLRNCKDCEHEVVSPTRPCAYGCLTCHGFYAATLEGSRFAAQLETAAATQQTGCAGLLLAVRLGGEGLCVVDAEGDDRSRVGITGVDALEEVGWEWPDTLRCRTGSGGLHLWFRVEGAQGVGGGAGGVRSRSKVLPNIDIKGVGGYVAVPPVDSGGRRWMNWGTEVYRASPGTPLGEWLLSARGHGHGRGRGADAGPGSGMRGSLALRAAPMIPAGRRYEFVRDLAYALRRRGWEQAAVLAEMRLHWSRMQQPPAAAYELPWRQVVYEVERVFARVEPEPPLADKLAGWMKSVRAQAEHREQGTV